MAHKEQRDFLRYAKMMFAEVFNTGPRTLDIGSRDINGNNRWLLSHGAKYTGIDLGAGPNVDVVAHAADWYRQGWDLVPFDLVLCTEALEHDRRWADTLRAAVAMLRPGGLLVITCAGPGRAEHGTHFGTPEDSPQTLDHYQNLEGWQIAEVLEVEDMQMLFTAYLYPPIADTYAIARKPEA